MSDKQRESVRNALRPWLNRSSPNASQHVIEKAADAAIEASDAKYVPMLVDALQNIADDFSEYYDDSKHAEGERLHTVYAARKVLLQIK